MKFHTSLLFGVVLILGSCANHEVIRSNNTLSDKKGAYYYLPKTAFDVKFTVKKTTKSPPSYSKFAPIFFGLKEALSEESATFSVDSDSIKVTPVGIKDSSHRYVSVFKDSPFATSTITVKTNQEGVLSSGDAVVENKAIDFTLKTVEAISSIRLTALNSGRSAAKGGNSRSIFYEKEGLKALVEFLNIRFKKQLNGEDLTPDALVYGIFTFLKTESFTKEKLIESLDEQRENKFAQQLETSKAKWDKATKASKDLYHYVRKATYLFIDYEATRGKYAQVTKAEDRKYHKEQLEGILAKFISIQNNEETETRTIRWTPSNRKFGSTKKPSSSSTIIELDPTTGVVWHSRHINRVFGLMGNDNLTKENIKLEISATSTIPVETRLWESKIKKGSESKSKKGWHYRIPAQSVISVKLGGSVVFSTDMLVAQHGCVAYLPASSGSVKVTSNIILDPSTGGLTSVTQGGGAASQDLISGFSSVADLTLKDRYTRELAKQQNAENAASEVKQLEKRKMLLQLRKEVKQLEETLGISNGN